MISRTLNLALAAAGAANAVLIPPSVSAAELDLGDDMAMEAWVNSLPRTASLDCATCEVASPGGEGFVWSQRGGSTFMLDFDVGFHGDSFNIDGLQLYPPTLEYFAQPFRIAQVNPDGENLSLRVTGYTFHYSSAETVSEAGIELLPMTFQINSIEGKTVAPPALTINLLKDPNGRLMIASFQTAKASKSNAEAECQTWPRLCKWKAMMGDKIDGLTSHMGKAGCHKHKSNLMAEDTSVGKPPHHFRPGHPHHRPHHKGGQHGYRPHRNSHGHMLLQRAFFTILIPILIGIFAGTLTYLVGMALGCLVAIAVAKFHGQSAYESVILGEESDVDDDERREKELCSELPEYDAPPIYEEVSEKEVAESDEEAQV